MKFAMLVVLACVVAFAAAAPQFLTYPGVISSYHGLAPYARTVVAGPTVVNAADPRIVNPGFICTWC